MSLESDLELARLMAAGLAQADPLMAEWASLTATGLENGGYAGAAQMATFSAVAQTPKALKAKECVEHVQAEAERGRLELREIFKAKAEGRIFCEGQTNEAARDAVFKRMVELVDHGYESEDDGRISVINAGMKSFNPASIDLMIRISSFWHTDPEQVEAIWMRREQG